MNPHVPGAIFSIVCLVAAILFMYRVRRMKLVYVMDYQAGVRFTDGTNCKILPPGAYRSNDGGSSIQVVDMRPHHFVIERVGYQNALLANSVISVGAELLIRDPRSVVSQMKNVLGDSLPLIREGIRIAGSRSIVDTSLEGRTKLAATIMTEINRELESKGVEVRNLEVTELWTSPINYDVTAVAN